MKKQTNMDTVLARVKGNRRAQRVASALACLVVFVTLWRLILPAITLEWGKPQAEGISEPETLQEEELLTEETLAEETEEEEPVLRWATLKEAEEAGYPDAVRVDRLSCEQEESETHRHSASCFESYYTAQTASFAEEAFLAMPAQRFEGEAGNLAVRVDAEEGAFPEATEMALTEADAEKVRRAAAGLMNGRISQVLAVDIGFLYEGEKIEPEQPVHVVLSGSALEGLENPVVLHIDGEGNAEIVSHRIAEEPAPAPRLRMAAPLARTSAAETDIENTEEYIESTEEHMEEVSESAESAEAADEAADIPKGALVFEAKDFSVYAVVSYTVDFSYEVDGKTFAFSLPGGGYLSFKDLVTALEIAKDDPETEENELDAFLADVTDVAFSNPDLVSVSKAEEDTTVGAIKEALGLACEYSAELTEEDIEKINATAVSAGDWALISLKPFDTEESLTVTLANGEVFTVKVTDAQEIEDSEKDTIDVNKSYLICYEVDGVYYLLKNDGTVDSAHHPDFEGDTDAAHDFEHLNSTYTWTFNHVFKEQDVEHHLDKNYYLIRPIDNKSSTLTLNNSGEALVQSGNNNVAVIQSGDGFILEGYHNVGTEEEPRYIHLGFDGSAFTGVDGEGVTVHIYAMDSLPTYDYIVRSADEIRGTVTVQGGTQQNVTEQGTVVAHYWDATSNHDKKNAGTITATPVTHVYQGQNKWLFDHWELDGLPLDRNQYGETISAESLPIPHNGSNLVAYFRQNPNYVVPPNEKEPSSIEDMTGWLEGLQTRNIPLDGSATKKTAEVYDYQNRIYRVDFTSKANFETFAGNIDMAFCLDVSNSMYFPSALVETTSANRANPMPIYQINNSGWGWSNKGWLDNENRGWDNPYYLIADASGTATVFKIYYKDGNWKAQDASRTTESEKSFVIGEDFKTNWTADQYDNQNNKNHPFSAGDNDNTTYMIYDAGDNGNNRFVYLNQSLSGSSTDLNTIANLLAVAGDASPGVKIAYNTFNGSLGNQRQDFTPASSGLTVNLAYASGGGTRPDVAFNDAKSFSWSADWKVENGELVTDRYVILVTDGAPQGGTAPSSGTVEDAVRTAARDLKNNSHVKLITVGLSMDNVTSGKRLLYDLADTDNNGEKMFYMAESGSDLQNIFRHITKVLMEDAVVLGNITDTVSEGFYLVDKATGLPLKATDTIDIEGNLTTDESEIAGVVQEDGRTVVWTNQAIDSVAGWHGTVYVKAQEELLGGNGMNTNDREATLVATKYRVGGKDVTFDTTLVRDTLNLTAELPSPKVNVNELTFFNNETEWTVYLGEEVDPKQLLKTLYESLVVEEVVNEDGSLHYSLSPNSIEERWDTATGTAATFSLPGLIEKLIRKDPSLEARYFNGTELNWDNFLTDCMPGGITLPYHEYGLTDGSNIKITLEKKIAANEEDDLINHSPHETTVTGDEVEKYVFKIAYEPDYTATPIGQGGQSTDDFHTGTYGAMYQGHAAGRETSTNEHVINVYNVPLDIYKSDEDNNALSGAEFKLYKEDDTGSTVAGLDSTKNYVEVATATSGTNGIARLKHEGEDFGLVLGEKYYLIETKAPADYSKAHTVWEVEVQTEIGKFTDLEGNVIYSTINPDPDAEPPVTVGNGVTSDMYPFNWDQGARIMLDGNDPVLVIAKGETEGSPVQITNGSFVSHEKAISFRHTILNLIGGDIAITAKKTWEDDTEQDRPDSIKVKVYRVSEKDHLWGSGVVVPSTCTTEGNKEYTCSVCGKKETYTISAAGHKPGTAHRENEVEATCTEAGGYDTVVRCTVCNAIISSEHTDVEALGHTPGETVQENYVEPTYTAAGGYDEVVYCTRCGEELSRTHVTIPMLVSPEHTVTITFYYVDSNGTQGNYITQRSGTGVGDMTIQWRWDQWTSPKEITIQGLGTSTFISTSNNNNQGALQTLKIQNITTDLNLNVFIWNGGWSGTNDNLIYQPSFAGVTTNSVQSTRQSLRKDLSTLSAPLLGEAAASDPVQAYLDAIGKKTDATCEETEGAVHTYNEYVGEYDITGTGDTWTLDIPDLPQYNEYGKEYKYYVVEDPALEGYEVTYTGQDTGLQDGSSTVTINNRKKKGSLKITKAVTVDDNRPSTDTASLTDGTYTFSIEGIADTPTAGISHTVSITFESGNATDYAIDNGEAQSAAGTNSTWAVVVPDLVPGDYTITETSKGNLVLKTVTGGKAISDDKVATVTVTDKDTTPNNATAQVVFTNNIETTAAKIIKSWDHTGNTGDHPNELKVTLSNGEERTLNADNNWTAEISGLPKYDSTGALIEYSWTEEQLPAGYYLSNISETPDTQTGIITTTITNSFTDHYNPTTTIKGIKIWDDGGATRPATITVKLYKDGDTTTPYRTETVQAPTGEGANPDEWPFEFTNLPIFNDDGTVIQYRVEEVLPEGYVNDYNVAIEFSKVTYEAGNITGEVVTSGQEGNQSFDLSSGVNLGYIVIKHGNNFIIWTPRRPSEEEVRKIRNKAEGLSSDFSDITNPDAHVYYEGQEPQGPHSIQVIWGVPRTINVGPKPAVSFRMKGDTVGMTFLNPQAWSAFCYGTIPYTYTQIGGEGGGTITNVKKVTEVSGTKTWVDGGRTHNNNWKEIMLTLKRTQKPVTNESVWEEVTIPTSGTDGPTFTWKGNTYTYSNLPRFGYDNTQNPPTEYKYEYKVEETAVNVTEGEGENPQTITYKMEANGNDFTNTEVTTVEATKTWKNGDNSANATITNASVIFELQRKNADNSWTAVPQTDDLTNPVTLKVEGTANADAWKATWADLPKYELVSGTPALIQYRVVETEPKLEDDPLTPGEPVVVTDGTIANIDNYLPVDLLIVKVDANNTAKKLKGATFTIQQIDITAPTLSLFGEAVTAETGTNGEAKFEGLTAGYYIVKETKLPAGYTQTGSGSFYIKVENGQVKLVEKTETGWQEITERDHLTFTAATATATVGNVPGTSLPSTGGPGTRAFTLAGLALTLLALAGITEKRKRG